MKSSKASSFLDLENISQRFDMRYNEKMKFVNDLLNRYYPKGNHSIWIWMGFVRPKTLYMAIYAIITEYEATHGAGIAENHTEESN